MEQIERDWNTRPFEDIRVTEEAQCPDTHPELVVYDMWYGMRRFYSNKAHPPVLQSKLGKFKICGMRSP